MTLPDDEKLPVAVSGVKRSLPRYYLETGVLFALVVALGVFLLTSRYWLDDEPWFVGVWTGVAEHAVAGSVSERVELRMTGTNVSGSASYRGVRRALEEPSIADDRLSFVTRGRDRIGNQWAEVTYRYTLEAAGENRMQVSVEVSGSFRDEAPLVFSLSRER